MLEYQYIKKFLQKAVFQIGLKRITWLEKLKILCHGHMLLLILKAKEIVRTFYEKELQKPNQKDFRVEKVI